MLFDFSICDEPAPLYGTALDTVFYINGDETYVTARKPVTDGKTYFLYTLKGDGLISYDGTTFTSAADTFVFYAAKLRIFLPLQR